MLDAIFSYLTGEHFMPHGNCYLWKPSLVWLELSTNVLIGLAYVAIAITLVVLVRRIRDIPFKLIYVAFAIFIVTCGFTHFMDAYVIWHPAYWVDAGLRTVTAVASVGTAILLPGLIPDAVALARGARAAHKRGMKLEAMVHELESMYERARELEQLKADFFANVSHELRTPLQLILGNAEMLAASEALGDAEQGRVEGIARSGRMLLKHVNDLLDVASMDAGEMQAHYAEVDVATLVATAAANFEALADQHDIAFVVDLPASLVGQVDPARLESVVLNLLSNAFKFTPAAGKVRCTLRRDSANERLVLEVADSGPGVPQEAREVIFERFRQLDRGATRRFGGTGLGLVIVGDAVALHGGRVSVTDAPEGGALFQVELPARAPAGAEVHRLVDTSRWADQAQTAAAATEAMRATTPAASAPTPSTAAPGRGKDAKPLVLIVEDNVDMNRFVCESLVDAYRVVSAFDGAQGLELASQIEPDLILTDIMMPEISGDELVRRVRSQTALAEVPIVILTAKADDRLRVEMLREGAQDYLTKPFEAAELRARVDNHVGLARARKILQHELHTSRRDVEALVDELAGRRAQLEKALETAHVARDQAERASRIKSQFLGMVSHELRTPVAALQLQVAVLDEDDTLPELHRELVERMQAALGRLSQLIEALLERAAIESGRVTVSPGRVEPGPLCDAIIEEMRSEARHKGLELRFAGAQEADPVTTDARLLRLILENLVRNALRYTDEGRVELSVCQLDGAHRFVVRDTGPGIAPDQRVRLFEPFERGEQPRRQQIAGAGLGLALVRDLVDALGGNIELDSEVGQGSSFAVVLPSGGPKDFAGGVNDV